MKILPQLALMTAIGGLGIGTISVIHSADKTRPAPKPLLHNAGSTANVTNDLAKPLLNRVFESGCTADKNQYYRETLQFTADGTTSFARRYYTDGQCQTSSTAASVRTGHYALEPEEAGRLLLTVRNLHGQGSTENTPYFEALIQIDRNQLVLDNGPSPAQQYTAI